MKKTILLLAFLLCLKNAVTQITIDSFTVYNTGTILDSFNVKIQSNGQLFSHIDWVKNSTACGTITWVAYFKGCETGQAIFVDTIFIHGFPSSHVKIFAVWDTSSLCVQPPQTTIMDSKVWDPCFSMGLLENENFANQINLSPNPASHFFNIFKPEELEIIEIQSFSSNGKRIPIEGKLEETIDISTWSEGVYFIEITTDIGTVRKKVIRL